MLVKGPDYIGSTKGPSIKYVYVRKFVPPSLQRDMLSLRKSILRAQTSFPCMHKHYQGYKQISLQAAEMTNI